MSIINGYSKLTKQEKLNLLLTQHVINEEQVKLINNFLLDNDYQNILDTIAENSITNFPLPLSIIPNVLINNEYYFVPVVTEESSVVAAASYAAKFWSAHGGF